MYACRPKVKGGGVWGAADVRHRDGRTGSQGRKTHLRMARNCAINATTPKGAGGSGAEADRPEA